VRYDTDIDNGTLQIEGGALRAVTSIDLAKIGFLTQAKTVVVSEPQIDLQIPVALSTIAEYGAVPIEAQTHSSAPDLPEASWTDVVDVTFDVGNIDDGGLVVVGFDGPDFTEPPLTPSPGRYRLRISAAHRDQPWTDEVTERYRFDAWPIDDALGPIIHRGNQGLTRGE